MSFKCSIFGHAYGDSEIEREREEEGNEVVTTIRERQTCNRCGETRVVSENKEVTTLETAADIVADELDEDEPEESAPTAENTSRDVEPASETDGTAILDAETGAAAADEETAESNTVTPPEQETDPATDDGVILEDEKKESPEREPGEWPDEPDDDGDEWKPETTLDPTPADEPAGDRTEDAVSVPAGKFRCPECGFTTPVEESSLRRGDFCPECHRGSLEHITE